MRKHFLVLLILFFTQASTGQEQCSIWVEKAELINSSAIEFEPSKSSDVILLGEHHLHRINNFLSMFLSEHSPEYNCLFLEMDRRLTSLPTRYEAFREIATSLNVDTHLIDFQMNYPDWMEDYLSNRNELFKSNREQYNLMEARVYEWALSHIENRNRAMSRRIEDLLNDGSCNKGVALLGSSHIYNQIPDSGATIPDILNEQSISFTTYLLEETSTFLAGTGLGGPQVYSRYIFDARVKFNKCVAEISEDTNNSILNTIFTTQDVISFYRSGNENYDGYFFIPQN